MSDQSTVFADVVQALLNEDQLFSLRERRDRARKNFVRPIRLIFAHKENQMLTGFTRDLSHGGIGLIHKFDLQRGDYATVSINRLWDDPVTLRCKAAWCAKSENGWYQSGWEIVEVESSNI